MLTDKVNIILIVLTSYRAKGARVRAYFTRARVRQLADKMVQATPVLDGLAKASAIEGRSAGLDAPRTSPVLFVLFAVYLGLDFICFWLLGRSRNVSVIVPLV